MKNTKQIEDRFKLITDIERTKLGYDQVIQAYQAIQLARIADSLEELTAGESK